MRPLSTAVSAVPPSGIRKYFDLAQGMAGLISLGVGEPDYATPWRVTEAGIAALESGRTSYTSNMGLPELRLAVCADLERRYGTSYKAGTECLVTAGVSEALDLAMRVLCDPGDEVIIPEPAYVAYGPCALFAGAVPVYVPGSAADGWRVDPAAVEAAVTPRTKAILVSSPANPTGAVQSPEDLAAIARIASQHDLYLVSDEIYAQLTYGEAHTCVSSLPGARERTILLGGVSKAYAMTGWRVGWLCAPEPVTQLACRIHQYTALCASHPAQAAALEALSSADADVQRMVADYGRRRRVHRRAAGHRAGLPRPGRGVLRLPLHRRDRPDVPGVRGAAAARGAGRGDPRRRVRAVGRGPRPVLLRHRDGRPGRGPAPHRPLRRQVPVALS